MQPSLPTGTITFLFTDIEGSTRLWDAHPDAMQVAVARHDALLRQAVTENGGYLFKTTGDGVAAAFAVAPDALAAALTGQQALLAETWPKFATIRARMGLHTSAAELRDGDYFGPTVNRVSRLMSAGHGGQTLLSDATHELCRDTLPDGVSLLPLGEHRLKDLARPETIYQLAHPTLASEFPPLQTLDVTPNNLLQQLTTFVGREKELTEVSTRMRKTRLLTLTGAGGTGKTRLSLQVAADALEQYADGVWQVEFAPLSDPALVPQTIAAALEVREQAGQTLTQTLAEQLKTKRLLLLFDNCEHLLQACASLAAALLRACPNVAILATSREALGIGGETIYRVPSLSLPDPSQNKAATAESLSQFESVRLFIDRAQLSKPDFAVTNANAPALAQLCYRLDGIPLALELAAARIRSLPVEQINEKLDNRFRLLTGGDRSALPRQQTLRALIDWGYDLLSKNEKTLMARLSVFAGGWTLQAAESVCAGEVADAPTVALLEDWEILDLLTSLADKSLLLVDDEAGASRYRMLETVRQYSAEKLTESGSEDVVRGLHRDFFVRLAEEAETNLSGPEQIQWLNRLETEHDNLRAVLEHCVAGAAAGKREAARSGLRLTGAMGRFWEARGHLGEGREHLSRALHGRQAALAEASDEQDVAAVKRSVGRVLLVAGSLAWRQGDFAAAWSIYEECLALYREVGDTLGIARTLGNLGIVAGYQGENRKAQSLHGEALALYREIGDKRGIAITLNNLGLVAYDLGDYDAARSHYEESLNFKREAGDKRGIASTLSNLTSVSYKQGDFAAARAQQKEGLSLQREIGDRWGCACSLEGMASLYADAGELQRGISLWASADALREAIGAPLQESERAELDATIAKARAKMSESEFADAWEEGRALTWEQAVDFALS